MAEYTKLSNLVGEEITIQSVSGMTYKKWDNDNKKMLMSPIYMDGYRKLYQVVTDKGQLDLGSGQLGSLLEAVFSGGKSDLINKTFHVKSNGKQGLDIRYFFNEVSPPQTDSSTNESDAPW